LVEQFGHADDLGHGVAGGHQAANLLVEDRQRNLVALVDDRVAQRGNHLSGVAELLLRALAVAHRRAGVEYEVADQVGLHLVLFDDVAAALEVNPPVDVLGVVAPDVLPVAGKLDGEARQRRLVATGQVADDQSARFDPPAGDPAEHLRVEVTGKDGSGHFFSFHEGVTG